MTEEESCVVKEEGDSTVFTLQNSVLVFTEPTFNDNETEERMYYSQTDLGVSHKAAAVTAAGQNYHTGSGRGLQASILSLRGTVGEEGE